MSATHAVPFKVAIALACLAACIVVPGSLLLALWAVRQTNKRKKEKDGCAKS